MKTMSLQDALADCLSVDGTVTNGAVFIRDDKSRLYVIALDMPVRLERECRFVIFPDPTERPLPMDQCDSFEETWTVLSLVYSIPYQKGWRSIADFAEELDRSGSATFTDKVDMLQVVLTMGGLLIETRKPEAEA